MMNKINFIFFVSFVVFNHSVIGQIETEELEVVKSFEIKLEDASKQTIKPKIEEVNVVKKVYDYNVTIIPLSLDYPDPAIKALATPVDKPFATKNIYVKAGYGNLKNPLAKVRYSQHDNDLYEISAYADFIGIDNSKNIDFQKMNSLKAGLSSKVRIRENAHLKVATDGVLDNRFFYFTPFDHTLSVNDDLKRNTQILNFKLGIENIEESDLGIDYSIGFVGGLVNTNNAKADQQMFGLEASLSKRRSNMAKIGLPISAGIYRYNSQNIEGAYTFKTLNFRPQLHYNNDQNMVFDLGMALNVDDHGTKPWPIINVSYGLLGNYVQVFVGTDQLALTNDLANSLKVNPWIESKIDTIKNIIKREYFGGVRGEFSQISYQVRAGYRQSFNQPLYINFKVRNQANLVFDRSNQFYTRLNAVFVEGNIDYWFNKYLNVGGMLTKNFYSSSNQETWGLPSIELNAYAKFNLLNDKIKLKAELYSADRSNTLYLKPSAAVIPEIEYGNNLADLNLELEFWPKPKFGVFGRANNLLDNKYARWFGYQQVGINFQGGVVVNL